MHFKQFIFNTIHFKQFTASNKTQDTSCQFTLKCYYKTKCYYQKKKRKRKKDFLIIPSAITKQSGFKPTLATKQTQFHHSNILTWAKTKKQHNQSKKKGHEKISAILDFLSYSKALAAISMTLIDSARNFLSLSVAFAALSWAIFAIWVASAAVWVTILFLSFASYNSLCSIDSFCCTKGVASFPCMHVGLSIQWKKGHLGPTYS